MIANVDGKDSYVRIQVPTNAGALEPRQAAAVVDRLTLSPPVTWRSPAWTWVLLTEVPDGLGLGGHANTNDMLVAAARTQVGLPRCPRSGQATRLRTNSASFGDRCRYG